MKNYLIEQKALDQCVYNILKLQCSTINQISEINQLLDRIADATLLLKSGKIASVIIPGLQGTFLLQKNSEKQLKSLSNNLAATQLTLLQKTNISGIFLKACGYVKQNASPLFSKSEKIKYKISQTAAPLRWINSKLKSYIEIQSYTSSLISYGQCFTLGESPTFITDQLPLGIQTEIRLVGLRSISRMTGSYLSSFY